MHVAPFVGMDFLKKPTDFFLGREHQVVSWSCRCAGKSCDILPRSTWHYLTVLHRSSQAPGMVSHLAWSLPPWRSSLYSFNYHANHATCGTYKPCGSFKKGSLVTCSPSNRGKYIAYVILVFQNPPVIPCKVLQTPKNPSWAAEKGAQKQEENNLYGVTQHRVTKSFMLDVNLPPRPLIRHRAEERCQVRCIRSEACSEIFPGFGGWSLHKSLKT